MGSSKDPLGKLMLVTPPHDPPRSNPYVHPPKTEKSADPTENYVSIQVPVIGASNYPSTLNHKQPFLKSEQPFCRNSLHERKELVDR